MFYRFFLKFPEIFISLVVFLLFYVKIYVVNKVISYIYIYRKIGGVLCFAYFAMQAIIKKKLS